MSEFHDAMMGICEKGELQQVYIQEKKRGAET